MRIVGTTRLHRPREDHPTAIPFIMTPLTTSSSRFCTACLLLLITLLGLLRTTHAACPHRHWFSAELDACVPCSSCTRPERSIVLRPCQPHQDIVCGTLNDLRFELNLLQTQHQQQQQQHEAAAAAAAGAEGVTGQVLEAGQHSWDWQPSSMVFAAVACVLFVAALVYILYQHAKQWRHMENMERRFDRDVEQLSAQLMHNIVDLRHIDHPTSASSCSSGGSKRSKNGRGSGKATALIVPASAVGSGGELLPIAGEMRCVYLEQLLVGASPIRGNVYTEETNKGAPPMPKRNQTPTTATSVSTGRPQQQQQQRLGQAPPRGGVIGLHRMHSAFGKK